MVPEDYNLHEKCCAERAFDYLSVYCGLAECQRPMTEQWWFAVQVAVCGAGVIPSNLKSRLRQEVLMQIQNKEYRDIQCRDSRLIPSSLFFPLVNRELGYEAK